MARYDELKEFVEANPGTTFDKLPDRLKGTSHIWPQLKRLVESGDAYRVPVASPNKKRLIWSYYISKEGRV